MKEFPGVVMVTRGKVHRKVLNEEQLLWLRKWFPVTENCRLAEAMGVSVYKIHSLAVQYGLKKSKAGLKAIRRRRDKASARSNERNGCYARKRGQAPSEATLEGVRRRWEEYRKGKWESTYEILRRKDPERFEAVREMRSRNRREMIHKERRRMLYGLPRKTRLHIVVMNPYTRSQIHHRYNALRRGYLLDEDCSEGSEGRYVIYYDGETERNEVFERNCIKDGFTIRKDG